MAALVLPMLVVAGYLGVNVRSATAQRSAASEQQTEVDRFVAVAAFSDAIGVENLVIIDRNATETDLAAARAETDAVVDLLRSPDLSLRDDTLAAIDARYAELLDLRALLGDRPFEIRLQAQSELRSGDLTSSGEVTPALTSLSNLPSDVLADFDFVSTMTDADTVELLDDYFLIQRYRADLSRELSTLLRVSSLPANLIDASITELVGVSISSTDQSRQLMIDLGSSNLIERADAVLNGATIDEYESLRSIVDDTAIGATPDVDDTELQIAGSRLDVALAGVADNTIAELDTRSSDAVFGANRDLVVSALIGFWLIVFVGLMLRVLYRAIKAPIERLTEQAQQISLIELPEIVAQMRRGEIDQIPEVEEIRSESNDEIGDLVDAFNGMHRTAVELAAEQANSRRVVANMFVNLGRRNQRLVNRLLKGLTVLEQHEQDPDKLASLYDIDHVATRMRRNAESLLVLAGAGQSRRWDKPVAMYDIARASLAEVENYERVQIDVGDSVDVDGGIVADLTHLLAELVENALSFSPPTSPVEIVARATGSGLSISVSDHGVGMPSDRLDEANRQITQAAGEDETPSEFLGHYVVGRLAARHGITVELVEGAAGGVTAKVLLPPHASTSVALAEPQVAADPLAGLTPSTQPAAEPDAVVDPLSQPEIDQLEELVASLDASAPALPAVGADPKPASVSAPVMQPDAAPVVQPEAAPVVPTERVSPQEQTPVANTLSEQAPRRKAAARIPSDPSPAVAAAPEPAPQATAASQPNPASFDWPSPLDVDPLSSERRPTAVAPASATETSATAAPAAHAPTAEVSSPAGESAAPAAVPALPNADAPSAPAAPTLPLAGTAPVDTAVPSAPATKLQPSTENTSDLNRAADSAVADALNVFGTQRRKPGAQLPVTDLFASISGSMTLGSSSPESPAQNSPFPPSSQPAAPARPASAVTDLGDEEQVRSALSGFQQGTSRADRENGDINP